MRNRLGKAVRRPKMKVIVDIDNLGFGLMERWVDITSYVTEISGSKQKESENLGGASTDTVTLTVDNSDNYFSVNKKDSLFYNKQKSNLRFAIKAGFEEDSELSDYVVGYIQTLKPTWKGRTYTLNCTCPMQKLKKAKCPKGSYHNVRWDELINVLLDESGIEKYFIRNIPKVELKYDYFRFEEEDCFSALKKMLEAVCGTAFFNGRNFEVQTRLALGYSNPTSFKHEFISDDYFEFEEVIEDSDIINKVVMTCEPKQVASIEKVASTPEHFISVDSEPHVYDGSGFIFVDESPLFYDDSNEITITNVTTGADVEWSTWNAEESRITLSSNGLLAVSNGDTLSVSYTYQQLVMLPRQEKTFSFSMEEEIDTLLEPDVVAWDSTLTNNVLYNTEANTEGYISKQSATISEDRKSVTITLKNNNDFKVSISTLQFRGNPVRVVNPIEVSVKNSDSISYYDEREVSITNNYINNVSIARKLSQYIVDNRSEIKKRLNVEIGGYQEQLLNDVCSVIEESSGTNHLMTIESIDFTFTVNDGWKANLSLLELPTSDWSYTDFSGTSSTNNKKGTTSTYVYGTTPPSDTNAIWIDTTNGKNIIKVYDPVTNTWIPAISLEDYLTESETILEIENAITSSEEETYTYVNNALVSKESIVFKQMEQPTNAIDKQLWIDTSSDPYVWKKYNAETGLWEELITEGIDSETRTKVSQAESDIAQAQTDIDAVETDLANTKTSLQITAADLGTTKADLLQTKSDLLTKATKDELDSLEVRVTQNEIDITNTEKELATKISQDVYEARQTVIDGNFTTITERVSSSESLISQQADEIASKVSKSTYESDKNTMTERISSAESLIQQNADSISTKVSMSEVTDSINETIDGIQIGGRNLFEKSGSLSSESIDTSNFVGSLAVFEDNSTPSGQGVSFTVTSSSSEGGCCIKGDFGNYIPKMIVGQKYTVSVWVKANRNLGSNAFSAEFLNNIKTINKPNVTTSWQKFSITGIYNGNLTSMIAITFYHGSSLGVGDILYISSPKVEEGNKSTSWTLAPEDVEYDINSLGTRVSTAESSILQQADKIATKVDQSTFDSTISGIGSRLTTAESNITQQANEISLKISQQEMETAINDLEIGGANILTNSSFANGLDDWGRHHGATSSNSFVTTYDGKKCLKIVGADGTNVTVNQSIYKKIKNNDNTTQTYTLSALLRCDNYVSGSSKPLVGLYVDGDDASGNWFTVSEDMTTWAYLWNFDKDGKWHRVSFTFCLGRKIKSYCDVAIVGKNFTGELYATEIKLEKGDKATDWTPSPLDTEEDISGIKDRLSTAESSIIQNSNQIALKVSQTTMENYVDSAISALSGDGRNMVLYGDCSSDIPRMEEENKYATKYATLALTDGAVKFAPNGSGSSAVYFVGRGIDNLLNGFLDDTYVMSFDAYIPSDSTLTTNKIRAILTEYDGTNYSSNNVDYLDELTPIGTNGNYTRYEVSYTFSQVNPIKRYAFFQIYSEDANAYVLLDNIKIERGSSSTPFTKNPNELAASELSDVKSRLTTAESNITQNSTSISSKVEKTEFTTFKNSAETRLDSAESAIVQNANEISTKVTQTQVNESISAIKLGTRNLLLNTKDSKTVTGNNSSNQCNDLYKLSPSFNDLAKNSSKVTISYDWTAEQIDSSTSMSGSFRLQFNATPWGGGISETITLDGTTNSGHSTITGVVNDSLKNTTATYIATRMDNCKAKITFKNMMFEFGSKESTWQPAPEDVQTEVTNLGTRVSTAESSIIQQADQIASKVSKSTYDSDMNGLTARVSNAESTITQQANQISSLVTQTQAEFNIGGRNLLPYTDFEIYDETNAWASAYKDYGTLDIDKESGWACLTSTATGGNLAFRQWTTKYGKEKLEAGKTYTIQLEAYATSAVTLNYCYILDFNDNGTSNNYQLSSFKPQLTTSPQRFTYTWTVGSNATLRDGIGIMVGCSSSNNNEVGRKIYVRHIMLEESTKPSAWTPSNVDNSTQTNSLTTRITSAESSITQNATDISARVKKTDYNVDMANLTSRVSSAETNITQNATAINQRATKTEFNALGSRVSTAESNITTMSNQIALKASSSEFNTLKGNFENLKIGATNKIKNSHFDEGYKNWNIPNENYIKIIDDGGFDGGKCIKIEGALETYRTIGQIDIGLEPNTEYVFTGWYKSENIVYGTTNPYVKFYISYNLGETWKGQINLGSNISGSKSWTKVTTKFTTPSSSEYDHINFYCYARDFTGNVYFDGIMLEKGNIASDWSPHPEDMNEASVELETRLAEAEIKLNDDSIVSTVTNSDIFNVMLSGKANADDLEGLATLTQVDNKIANIDIEGSIDDRIVDMINDGKSDLNLTFASKAEVTQTANSITENFSMANGLNLLKNSTGFAGRNHWLVSSTATANTYLRTGADPELDIYGIGCGFHITANNSSTFNFRQQFIPEVNKTYTLSALINKRNITTADGENSSVYVQFLKIASDGIHTPLKSIYVGSGSKTNGYEMRKVQYTFTDSDLDDNAKIYVRVYGYPYANFSVAGIMLHKGSIPLQWTLASGEVANLSVITDINGIRVNRLDSNENVTGYTSITPDEFAGYHDSDGDGTLEKVFWLDEDETCTKKVRATNEITMGSIKIVNIGSGWAFVKNS